mmetsp:Transcript_29265/g.61230  ORF Transcript_29265/g.61230 Transcript_29265/m.61230 type:complete len:511 (-) Transcript_29265:406-1938(-)|eukprot:CAMPEP_0172449480 /NCGR_PEP_ID=MMETSP1065-20121228/8181_1 /TAXON_ID=265537 /ORGANISM="Amphiprora paludosa, Strain CCMP125" /LENGTH=510 /DNA_ID=CAMNT_0013201167 /DNA_START=71 /DNA_END=1603 /DNA_ORIENTATION=+
MQDKDEIIESFTRLQIPSTHATVGLSNWIASQKDVRTLFVNRRLPDQGWSDLQIQHLLLTLATLDTNSKQSKSNSSRWCGVGEREGRVYSSLVASRHYGLSHGMGRSGDLMEPQPKAVGSSVLVQLTLILVLDALRRGSGLTTAAAHGILLPLCTGMSMALVLSSLREQDAKREGDNENSTKRNIVLWSRIDQKSCFKAVQSAGLTCVVVPTKRDGDQVVTDVDALEAALQKYKGQVLAVMTTTSCFAPRVPDQVDVVAKLCTQHDNVAHIINHAYGLQCAQTCKLINRACTIGRVDAVICSTDKNFLVPVGGALVVSPHASVVAGVSQIYAGRASSTPVVDLFITLLSMGLPGYQELLQQRRALVATFPDQLRAVAAKYGERVLSCPDNTISFGMTLDSLAPPQEVDEDEATYHHRISKDITRLGAMLFSRCVSGTRVVPRGVHKTMGTQEFAGFGSSTVGYPHAYMTAACAIGLTEPEMQEFLRRLDKTLKDFVKKKTKKQAPAPVNN